MTRLERRVDMLEWLQLRAEAATWGADTGLSAEHVLAMIWYVGRLPAHEQRGFMGNAYEMATAEERAAFDASMARALRIVRAHPELDQHFAELCHILRTRRDTRTQQRLHQEGCV